MKTDKNKVIVLACSVIQSMMHGVVYFTLKGDNLTAHYTDTSTETVKARKETVAHLQMYAAYQANNGPGINEPNSFALVQEIQSHRT